MPSSLHALIRVLDRYKWWYLSSAGLIILSSLVRSLEPRVLQITVDNVISPLLDLAQPAEQDSVVHFLMSMLPDIQTDKLSIILISLAAMYIIISLLRGGFLFSAESIKAWSAEKVAKGLRDNFFAHIQRLPLSYFTTTTRGELIQRSTGDIDTVKGFFKGQLMSTIRIVSIFVISFWNIAIIDWQLALVAISLSPVIGITAYLFFKKDQKVWEKHEAESDKLNNMVQENLNGIRTVSAYANEQWEIDRFAQQNQRKLAIGLKHNLLHTWFWPSTDLMTYLQIVMAIIVGGWFAMQGRITIGELIGAYTYIGMVAWPMRQLGRLLSEMGMALVAMERLSEVLEAKEESSTGAEIDQLAGDIKFENVSFRYRPDDEFGLQNISFHLKAGETLALIGPTGSGKSSLIKLLLRLYDPAEGKILIDGKEAGEINRQSLRKRIGLALQKPFLFSASISENIAYPRPDSDEKTIRKASKMAQFAEIEQKFPNGYETLVGEKGVTLSGGQKQRVALARTLVSEPDMLILDDITSAVDTETEQNIFSALSQPMKGKTTIIISHRITSIQQADRVLVMEKGKIVQQGSPAELEKVPGYYQQIYQIQTAVEREILA